MSDLSKVYSVAESTNPTRSNSEDRLVGIYRARCEDNKDPSKSGRVKLFVPEMMHGSVQSGDGVWALPASLSYSANVENGKNGVDDCGSCLIPPIGSYVYCFFENGDPNKARYLAGATLSKSLPTEMEAGSQWYNKDVLSKRPNGGLIMNSNDPSDCGIVLRGPDRSKGKRSVKSSPLRSDSIQIVIQESNAGSFIRLNDGSGNFILINEGATTIQLHIKTGTDVKLSPSGLDINVQGTTNIKSSGPININGATVNLNC